MSDSQPQPLPDNMLDLWTPAVRAIRGLWFIGHLAVPLVFAILAVLGPRPFFPLWLRITIGVLSALIAVAGLAALPGWLAFRRRSPAAPDLILFPAFLHAATLLWFGLMMLLMAGAGLSLLTGGRFPWLAAAIPAIAGLIGLAMAVARPAWLRRFDSLLVWYPRERLKKRAGIGVYLAFAAFYLLSKLLPAEIGLLLLGLPLGLLGVAVGVTGLLRLRDHLKGVPPPPPAESFLGVLLKRFRALPPKQRNTWLGGGIVAVSLAVLLLIFVWLYLPMVLYLVGVFQWQQGNTEASLELMDAALRLDPDMEAAYVVRASVYLQQEDIEAAARDAEHALQIAAESALVQQGMGFVRAAQGDYPAAIEHLTRALELDPTLTQLYGPRGELYVYMDEFELAYADLQNYLAQPEVDPEIARRARLYIVWYEGNFEAPQD